LHGEERNKQVERAGIRVGDSIILERPIKRAFAPDSFSGAYLDNGD
jgi:endoglucanase